MVSFCGRKPPEEPYSPPEVVPGDINSYIENRLNDQITWYDKKAQQAQRTYKRMQLTELIVATPFRCLPIIQPAALPSLLLSVCLAVSLPLLKARSALAAIMRTGSNTALPAKC